MNECPFIRKLVIWVFHIQVCTRNTSCLLIEGLSTTLNALVALGFHAKTRWVHTNPPFVKLRSRFVFFFQITHSCFYKSHCISSCQRHPKILQGYSTPLEHIAFSPGLGIGCPPCDYGIHLEVSYEKGMQNISNSNQGIYITTKVKCFPAIWRKCQLLSTLQ